MKQRWHIYFFGNVQNVGFRFTCLTTAKRYDVTGWVKNLPDGSVEMTVEGDEKTLRQYVDEVCESTQGRVDEQQLSKSDATGEFDSMQVIH